LRTIAGVDAAFVTNVPGAGTVERFKVPTVWLLLESGDALPRGGTGKVDVGRLRKMLADA
jgi:acyl-CoA synthetase (AMP-forming)/AMP-acid ligase II